MRSLLILIPGRLPQELSPNWQPKNTYASYIRGQQMKTWKQLVFLYAVNARNIWERQHKQDWMALKNATIQVWINYTPQMKIWDSTNIRGALKPLEDGIVEAEIIVGDDPSHLTWLGDPIWFEDYEPEILIEIKELE